MGLISEVKDFLSFLINFDNKLRITQLGIATDLMFVNSWNP